MSWFNREDGSDPLGASRKLEDMEKIDGGSGRYTQSHAGEIYDHVNNLPGEEFTPEEPATNTGSLFQRLFGKK